jgi:hypothetical protein
MEDKPHPGYVDMIDELTAKFPLSEPQIVGEQNQKDFIALFGAILRMRNLLSSFDEFKGHELISERDLQDYLGRYQDLRDEWRRKREDKDADVDMLMFSINPAYDYHEGAYAIGSVDERSGIYRRCEAENIGITVMKPFSGGQLLNAHTN